MSAAEPLVITKLERPSYVAPVIRRIAGPFALLLMAIGFFWKLVLTTQYSWIESPDIANQVVPWLNYQAMQFHAHRLPLWDPFLFGGQSLIGQGQPGAAYPLNWILFAMPLDQGHINLDILNWYFVAIHYLAALFCYFLCRDMGRGRTAAVLGGAAFGLGGYVLFTDWPQMINGAIWGPLVFLFLFRAARGVRPMANAVFSGLFLGVSWLSGHHQIPIFLTLATCGVWLYFLFEHGRLRRELVAPAAVFAAFFVCAGALQTWPAYEYGREAVRWSGSQHDPLRWNEPVPYTVHQAFSISPIYLLGILIPGYSTTSNPFIGVSGLALAAFGLACFWKKKEVRIIFAAGVAGLFLALAKNDVFHGMLYAVVPFVEKARSPGAAIYLAQFAVAVLMAFGLDAFRAPGARPLLRRFAYIVLGCGVVASLVIFAIDAGHSLNWTFDDRVMMFPLAAFALAALMYRFGRSGKSLGWISTLLIGLYLVEQANESIVYTPAKNDPNLGVYLTSFDTTKEVAQFLKQQAGPVRAEVRREDVGFNFGDWYGIDTMSGNIPSMPAELANLGFFTGRTMMLFGTNYTVARKSTMEGQEEVFRDRSDLIVFKNPKAFPRVWTVHDAVKVKDPGEAFWRLQNATDVQTTTFSLESPPAMEHCEGDEVRSFVRDINSTAAVVDMKCRGIVIQGENAAPGWTATVDGKPAPIFKAYTTLRGVVVAQGVHKIEMRYRPLSVIGGALATSVAFLGALGICVANRLRRRG